METRVKKLAKRMVEPFRPRLRPSFLIVGAQKAGTSALFEMLARHPKLLAPEVKELDFFSRDENHDRGIGHYLDQFPLRPWDDRGQRTFEASPSYLDSPEAPARIKAAFPDMRIIIILRDPVKRAFSAWNMYRQFEHHPKYAHRYDPRDLVTAIEENMRGGPGSGPVDDYLERGIYAPRVQRYFDVFGRDKVLVIPYPRYRSEPQQVLDEVCDHVGLERMPAEREAARSSANKRPYESPMPEALKERLYRYFAPAMHDLRRLVGPAADICEEKEYRPLWSEDNGR